MSGENQQSIQGIFTTENIWKSKNVSLAIKIKLYESLVLSMMLYGAKL